MWTRESLAAFGGGSQRATLAMIECLIANDDRSAPAATAPELGLLGASRTCGPTEMEDLVVYMFARELVSGTMARSPLVQQKARGRVSVWAPHGEADCMQMVDMPRASAVRLICDRLVDAVAACENLQQKPDSDAAYLQYVCTHRHLDILGDPGVCALFRRQFLSYLNMHFKGTVRWGYHAPARNRTVPWTRANERTPAFQNALRDIIVSRNMESSLRAAYASARLQTLFPPVEFSSDMSVADALLEADLASANNAADGDTVHFVTLIAALRCLLTKNIACARTSVASDNSLVVFQGGGWRAARSVDDVANAVAASTVTDLEILRSGKASRAAGGVWMKQRFNQSMASVTHLCGDLIVQRIAAKLQTLEFLDTIVPLDPDKPMVRPPSVGVRVAPHTGQVSIDEGVGHLPVPREESPLCILDVDGSPELAVYRSHLVNAGIRGSFGAQHEGAAVYLLGNLQWMFPKLQDRGSVYIMSVSRFLGYLGLGLHAYGCVAHDAEGETYAGVAVTNTNKGDVDGDHVVADMVHLNPSDCALSEGPMRNNPQARATYYRRVKCPAPLLTRPLFPLSKHVVARAADHHQPIFATTETPRREECCHTTVLSHAHPGGEEGPISYTFVSGECVVIPCNSWASVSDTHRSSIRRYWADCAVCPGEVVRGRSAPPAGCWAGRLCPHDIRMRMTRTDTYVVFDDAHGRGGMARQYSFSPQTMIAGWDGALAIAQQRDDAIVYVLESTCAESRYRLIIVAGLRLVPGVPRATAGLIRAAWDARHETCPHMEVLDDDDVDSRADSLISVVHKSPGELADWLRQQAADVSQYA